MGTRPTKALVRLTAGLLLAGGCAFALHAGPPAASVEQARAAIVDVRQLHDNIQASIQPSAPAQTETGTRVRGRTPRTTRTTSLAPRTAHDAPTITAVEVDARARQHAERSLQRVALRLEQAERRAERNPDYALHRTEVARHELNKVARRLGIQIGGVQ